MKFLWSSFLHLVKVNTKMPCGWFFVFAPLIKVSWFFHSVRDGLKSFLLSRVIEHKQALRFPVVRREMCVEIQIISEHSPRVGNKTSSLCGYGHLFAECWLLLSGLLSALNQCDTIRKKQRYAFLIHFLPGVYKMWCFVGNLLGLFLIGAWDVRKHSDFRPCTVAEFTFNEDWGKAAFGQQGARQPWHSSVGFFLLLPDAQLQWHGWWVYCYLVWQEFNSGRGLYKQLAFLAGLVCLSPEIPGLRSKL